VALPAPIGFTLEIEFDLQFDPSFSEKHQKYEQYQDDHKAVPLSTPGRLCRPRSQRGFCIFGVHELHADFALCKT
jgi:hypothetical protein